MKVVINRCFGGFELSSVGVEYYFRLKGMKEFFYYTLFWDSKIKKLNQYKRVPSNKKEQLKDPFSRVHVFSKDFGSDGIIEISSEDFGKYCLDFDEIDRTDKDLIQTVADLGEDASSENSQLVIVEIPDDVQWQIEEYDGVEWVAEVHRTWSGNE